MCREFAPVNRVAEVNEIFSPQVEDPLKFGTVSEWWWTPPDVTPDRSSRLILVLHPYHNSTTSNTFAMAIKNSGTMPSPNEESSHVESPAAVPVGITTTNMDTVSNAEDQNVATSTPPWTPLANNPFNRVKVYTMMAKEGLLNEDYCRKLKKLIEHMTPDKSRAWYQEVQVHLPDHLKAILKPSHIQDGDLTFEGEGEGEKKKLDDQHSTIDGLEKPVAKTTFSMSNEELLFESHGSPIQKTAANARKTISNDAFLLFRNQFSSAEKLVVKTAGSISNDELSSNALSDITISKPNPGKAVSATPSPYPTANPHKQSEPSLEQPKPSRSNPFYRHEMTLALAAQNIAAYFREAVSWLVHYHISTPASTLVDLSHKPSSILNRIFSNIHHTAEFLRFRRKGWDLRLWPDNFFEDVLPLIMITCGKLEKLGEWKGCERMMAKAWGDAEEVGEGLVAIRDARVLMGKETWERRERKKWEVLSRVCQRVREDGVGAADGKETKLTENRDENVLEDEEKETVNEENEELNEDDGYNEDEDMRLAKEEDQELTEEK